MLQEAPRGLIYSESLGGLELYRTAFVRSKPFLVKIDLAQSRISDQADEAAACGPDF